MKPPRGRFKREPFPCGLRILNRVGVDGGRP